MSKQKAIVATPKDYPTVAPKGYYSLAFKKDKAERLALKEAKKNNKAAVRADYGNEFNAEERKKILNPKTFRLGE